MLAESVMGEAMWQGANILTALSLDLRTSLDLVIVALDSAAICNWHGLVLVDDGSVERNIMHPVIMFML